MISEKVKFERLNRALRFNKVRENRRMDCKEFSRMLNMTHSTITRVCSGSTGMSLVLLRRVSYYLTKEEIDFIQTAEPMSEEMITKSEPENTGYTDDEKEIISLLRQMPEFRKKILSSLRNKAYLKSDYYDFMKA